MTHFRIRRVMSSSCDSISRLRSTFSGKSRAAIEQHGATRHQRGTQSRGPSLETSRAGMLERRFTLAFKRLVYPQIWEDPVVDMKTLDIGPGHEVIAIASGGCNCSPT